MSFMQKQIWREDVWEVETSQGTELVPADLVGPKPSHEDFKDYLEGDEVYETELHKNKVLARMSAPGYMDQTCLLMFDTEQEAGLALTEANDCY